MLKLGARAAGDGFRLEHVSSIGSTNVELFVRARDGDSGQLWLIADEQTSGKGRRERAWTSPVGNLYASLLLRDPGPQPKLHELSFVLALALRDAVQAWGGEGATLTLKWPNDLMAGGLKTAGLLLEGGAGRGTAFLVAGFGINVVSHPLNTQHPATHLRAAGYEVDRDGLFLALSDAVAARLAVWNRGEGFAAIRRDWLAHAYGLGQRLRVNMLNESFEGRFAALDEAGQLIVETTTGMRTVSAGDVFVLGERDEGSAA